MEELRTCTKCHISKPLTKFKKNYRAKTGYLFTCKACDCLDAHAYRAANPEKVKATQKADAKQRRERTALAKENRPNQSPETIAVTMEIRRKNRRKRQRILYVKKHPKQYSFSPWPRPTSETCHHCGRRKLAEEFVKCTSIKRGFRLICKPCNNIRSQKYDIQHGEERRILKKTQNLIWRQANPEKIHESSTRRKARKKNDPINDLSADQWKEIQAVQDYRCAYCPSDCIECRKRSHKLTPDHITPFAKGGNNTLQNIVPACLTCNIKKRTGPPLKAVQPLLLSIASSKKKRTKATPTDQLSPRQ